MMKIQTVRLELLRPGPPHNQLLSPLTSYIALCGDEPPESVHVPFEHYRVLRRIQALRQPQSREEAEAALTELREDVVRLLSSIRCLSTSLAEAQGDGGDLIELELVLSASELSLIPFEIAFVPGSPTREISHREVIITRRSRRVPRARLHWEHRPRILLVAASPAGVEPVPVEAHVAGMREALGPWLTYLDGHESRDLRLKEIEKFITVLPNATELSIQETMRVAREQRQGYTHVHILAHGGELSAGEPNANSAGATFREPRFGLVLHDSREPNRPDVLGGRRIFSAIAATNENCERGIPQVVTLASCDSGNIGGVIVPGASVAHDIHDGGVPLVVASQFPLSYYGSVVFVKRLYERLLAGDDPRCALRETRRAIHASRSTETGHVDWGAVVNYGALPRDLDKSVYDARIRALRQRVDSAISSVDPDTIPRGRSDPKTAWTFVKDGLDALATHATDPSVDRYIARAHLRWAFVMDNGHTETDEQWKSFAKSQDAALPLLRDQSLRAFRDGLRRHYQATGNPVSLVEFLIGNYFLGDPVPLVHATTATTGCAELLENGKQSRADRRKLRRSLVDLWIIAPYANPKSDEEREPHPGKRFQAIFDQLFSETPPSDYEYFAALRQYRRIEHTGKNNGVSVHAKQVAEFLERRGVRTKFSAIVDWVPEPDGGRRTIAT